MVKKAIKYTIFKTKWGYFGLAAAGFALCRTHLPLAECEKIESQLLKDLDYVKYDKTLFKTLQKQIIAYFEGALINFSPDIPIVLDEFSPFAGQVLTACRHTKIGQTISYTGLAKRIHRPKAARAVGAALAKNPLPLLIPCHRVIKSNGQLGGFTSPGGITLKKKLLELEHKLIEA